MRLSICYPTGLEMGHTRHLFDAVARQPIQMVVPQEADWSINVLGGKHAALIWVVDPHGLPADAPNDQLADPRFLAAMSPIHRAMLDDGLAVFRRTNTMSLVDASRGYDLLALQSDWPFRDAVRSRLGRVGYIRVEPRVPEWIFYPDWNTPKTTDGFFIGNDQPEWYPLRWKINNWFKASGFKYSYNPGRPPNDPIWRTTATFDDHQRWYADKLRHTKLVATCGSVFNIAVNKYFEAMACGCLLLCPLPHEAELLGFRNGYNMVEIGVDDFADKIGYYLAHDTEREAIARRGADFCLQRHSCSVRAVELLQRLEQIAGGADVDAAEAERNERLRAAWASQSSS